VNNIVGIDLSKCNVEHLGLFLVSLSSLPFTVDSAVLRGNQKALGPSLDFIVINEELNDVRELIAARKHIFVDQAGSPLLVLTVLRVSQVHDEAFGLSLW
jgi:hypothetical protein